jgi:hypothetical protein
VIKAVDGQLTNIIDGLDVYKNAFETVGSLLYGAAL